MAFTTTNSLMELNVIYQLACGVFLKIQQLQLHCLEVNSGQDFTVSQERIPTYMETSTLEMAANVLI
jgi:hypothetical protein